MLRGRLAVGALAAVVAMSAGAEAATPDPTRASGGYLFFNRPAASLEDYRRDIVSCMSRSYSALPGAEATTAGRVHTTVTPMFPGLIAAGFEWVMLDGRIQTDVQNCMTIAGWRLMRIGDTEVKALQRLPREEGGRRLMDWTSAASPPGELARSYENDAVRRGTTLFTVTTPFTQPGSHLLAPVAVEARDLTLSPPKSVFRASYGVAKYAPKILDPGGLRSPGPGEAMVIFSWSGTPLSKNQYYDVRRFGPTPNDSGFETDGRPDQFMMFERKATVTSGERRFVAMIVPTGRWRLFVHGGLELCFGAPAFEAKEGNVLFLGQFDLAADTLGPDMNTADLAERLSLTPDLAAKLRPAAWVNGAQWPCHLLFAAFAEEFPGFPSERPAPR